MAWEEVLHTRETFSWRGPCRALNPARCFEILGEGINQGKAVTQVGGGTSEYRKRLERAAGVRSYRGAGISSEEEAALDALDAKEREKRRKVSDASPGRVPGPGRDGAGKVR